MILYLAFSYGLAVIVQTEEGGGVRSSLPFHVCEQMPEADMSCKPYGLSWRTKTKLTSLQQNKHKAGDSRRQSSIIVNE